MRLDIQHFECNTFMEVQEYYVCISPMRLTAIGAKKLFWIKHHLLKSLSSPICEKLDSSICRYALGVHRKTQISAGMGELGRYPLGIDIVLNILAYHEYLETKSDHSIMKELSRLASQIANDNDNPKLWITHYNKFLGPLLQMAAHSNNPLLSSFESYLKVTAIFPRLLIRQNELWTNDENI